jgi:hypothetical protein
VFIKNGYVQQINGLYTTGEAVRRAGVGYPFLVSPTSFNDILSHVHKPFNISKNQDDYLFVIARAVTADIPNENRDCFSQRELLSVKKDGRFTFETFQLVPLLQEHRDEDIRTSGGVIIDPYYDDNENNDKKVITLIALDASKRKREAMLLRQGKKISFSMGCLCESTTCSMCGHTAHVPADFCVHIKNKYARADKTAFEYCNDVIFRELSIVADPADKKADSYEVCTPSGNCRLTR